MNWKEKTGDRDERRVEIVRESIDLAMEYLKSKVF